MANMIKYNCTNINWICDNIKGISANIECVCVKYRMGCRDILGVAQAIRYEIVYLRYLLSSYGAREKQRATVLGMPKLIVGRRGVCIFKVD